MKEIKNYSRKEKQIYDTILCFEIKRVLYLSKKLVT